MTPDNDDNDKDNKDEDGIAVVSTDHQLTSRNLHAGDRAILQAAQTGEGLLRVTPEILQEMGVAVTARREEIDTTFPELVRQCPYQARLACWVVEQIVAHAREGGTFRYLIYQRLGFGPDAYMPMLEAGAMTISNHFELTEEDADGQAGPDSDRR